MELVPGLLAQLDVHFQLHHLIVCNSKQDKQDNKDRY